jgi:hypothetical protein
MKGLRELLCQAFTLLIRQYAKDERKEGNMKDARLLFHKLIPGHLLMVSDDIMLYV